MTLLKTLRGDNPGLFGWAQNAVTHLRMRERQGEVHTDGGREEAARRGVRNVTVEAEIRVMQSQIKQRWQPPNAARGKEQIFL